MIVYLSPNRNERTVASRDMLHVHALLSFSDSNAVLWLLGGVYSLLCGRLGCVLLGYSNARCLRAQNDNQLDADVTSQDMLHVRALLSTSDSNALLLLSGGVYFLLRGTHPEI